MLADRRPFIFLSVGGVDLASPHYSLSQTPVKLFSRIRSEKRIHLFHLRVEQVECAFMNRRVSRLLRVVRTTVMFITCYLL